MLDMFISGQAAWFGVPAVAGTLIFILKLVLMFVGGETMELDTDIDSPSDGALDGSESTGAFKALSLQSIAAFCMGFGWGGLGVYHGLNAGIMMSIVGAIGGGVLMVWVLAMLLRGLLALQSDGTASMRSAMGVEGDVYVTVPSAGAGRGQVRIVVSGRQRIVNAITEGEALPTSARVRVVKVNGDNTVLVVPAG
ncbi:MAG: NfeD family protein [Phycisphaeraceae bacterium]|nr:NfeD family protein [Phycisphaeraceae bacterium]MBX3365777.1 NfeD family protein [Phycisphaeraceae bacterium]